MSNSNSEKSNEVVDLFFISWIFGNEIFFVGSFCVEIDKFLIDRK